MIYIKCVMLVCICSVVCSLDAIDKKRVFETQEIFREDLWVKDFNGNAINLKNVSICKDTVVVFAWCRTCGACIKYLNYLKNKNCQIITVAITENDSINTEKKIANRFNWNFDLFYDNKGRLANYLYKKGILDKRYVRNNKIAFRGFPNIYLFVKGVLQTKNVSKYANPYANPYAKLMPVKTVIYKKCP